MRAEFLNHRGPNRVLQAGGFAMQQMPMPAMGGMGTMMMAGMGIQWLLLTILILLAIVALVKYLRTPPR
jgi:hypothetical protein